MEEIFQPKQELSDKYNSGIADVPPSSPKKLTFASKITLCRIFIIPFLVVVLLTLPAYQKKGDFLKFSQKNQENLQLSQKEFTGEKTNHSNNSGLTNQFETSPNTLNDIKKFLAAFLLSIAAFTDWLDGYLARKRKEVSTFGALLDPIADKLLVAATVISLVQINIVPAWMAVILVGRDTLITGLRSMASAEGFSIPVNRYGKLSTTILLISLIILILEFPSYTIAQLSLWLALILTALSGFIYFYHFLKLSKLTW